MKPHEIAGLTKDEIIWLSGHTCKHGHKYLSHYQCYLKEIKDFKAERIGILDIETTGLDANWEFMLSYAIKQVGVPGLMGRTITRDEIQNGDFDANMCREIVDIFRRFDRIVGYYIKDRRFDIPFIRTRCLAGGVDFPKYGEMKITDLYDIVKNKLKLGRSSLAQACGLMGIASKGHPLDNPKVRLAAKSGDPDALEYTWLHNVEDVISTEALYNRIKDFQRPQKTNM